MLSTITRFAAVASVAVSLFGLTSDEITIKSAYQQVTPKDLNKTAWSLHFADNTTCSFLWKDRVQACPQVAMRMSVNNLNWNEITITNKHYANLVYVAVSGTQCKTDQWGACTGLDSRVMFDMPWMPNPGTPYSGTGHRVYARGVLALYEQHGEGDLWNYVSVDIRARPVLPREAWTLRIDMDKVRSYQRPSGETVTLAEFDE